jgi:hypothetical protein
MILDFARYGGLFLYEVCVLEWLKWFFWTSRRCEHVRDPEPLYYDTGMSKAWACEKCGKVLETV